MTTRPPFALACLAAALALGPVSCARAVRYPAARPAAPEEPKAEVPAHYAWLEVEGRPDLPIVFVPESDPDWARLPAFWNHFPPPPAGMRTVHLGLPPLQAVAALALAEGHEAIKIKVPAGLPDPRPHVPAVNPPGYARWKLGKRIFFDRVLKVGPDSYACATCHDPAHGFTETRAHPPGGAVNTLGLINVVYNRRQFWDGRVEALEETIVRALADEAPPADKDADTPATTHRWGGLVRALDLDEGYRAEFRRVFGIAKPTQDAIAKAVATYLRTILSGDSLYDRAERRRRTEKAPALAAAHFRPHLDPAALVALFPELAEKPPQDLGELDRKKDEAARLLALGAGLFHGRARCAACHGGPLFTDHDFHNVGLGERDSTPPPGQEGGRFASVPTGLKEGRLIGAFRTPTLRALPRTSPYFHPGKHVTLRQVVAFFDLHVVPNPHLAAPLRDGDRERVLNLADDEKDALVLFLLALDGTPVDPIVSQ